MHALYMQVHLVEYRQGFQHQVNFALLSSCQVLSVAKDAEACHVCRASALVLRHQLRCVLAQVAHAFYRHVVRFADLLLADRFALEEALFAFFARQLLPKIARSLRSQWLR